MRHAELRHFIVIYDAPASTIMVRPFDDHAAAVAAYDEIPADQSCDVALVSAESLEAVERLQACSFPTSAVRAAPSDRASTI